MLKSTCILWAILGLAVHSADSAWAKDPVERIVFVGDSITDGHTYPLLVHASLQQAGKPVPVCINAGVAGDTAQGMLARLDRDVFPHRPTLVTLSAGINDVLRGVSTEDYARDMRSIAVRMQREKLPLVILTPSVLGPKHAAAEEKLAEYIAALREIARDHDCRIAEVHAVMEQAARAGEMVLGADEVHLSQAGYRHFTRALLDAIGFKDVPVVLELKYELMPGVIKNWQVRAATEGETMLEEADLPAALAAGVWQEISLPFEGREDDWWVDQERQRGFAVSLGRRIGAGKKYLAKTEFKQESTQKRCLNVGAQVDKVWLNGKLLYQNTGWRGWHAGKERISVTFGQGQNILILETGDTYFLSITPDANW